MKKPKEVEVYLDGTDWIYEIGRAADGNTIYASAEDLKKNSNCWDSCGIAKCKLVFKKWIVKNDLSKSFKRDRAVSGEWEIKASMLKAAEKHLKRLEEKVEKQKNRVISLKTDLKGRK
jgi:hypothetical protein